MTQDGRISNKVGEQVVELFDLFLHTPESTNG